MKTKKAKTKIQGFDNPNGPGVFRNVEGFPEAFAIQSHTQGFETAIYAVILHEDKNDFEVLGSNSFVKLKDIRNGDEKAVAWLNEVLEKFNAKFETKGTK